MNIAGRALKFDDVGLLVPWISWSAALDYVAQYWTGLDPLVAAAATVGALLASSERASRRGLGYVAGTVTVTTLLMIVVVKRSPGELYPYIGLFYLGAPLALSVAAVATGLIRSARTRWARSWAPSS